MANFNYRQLVDWMELVREHPDAVNCFWPSQIHSKRWLVEQVEYQHYFPMPFSCVIFGSWYGILADMLSIEDTTCVDTDNRFLEWCGKKYDTWHGCMSKYEYDVRPDLVLNTVTEHVNQEIYDEWFKNIPEGTFYIIQGNNDFQEKDHIRACEDLGEFILKNSGQDHMFCEEIQYEGPWNEELDEPTVYKRFMIIGKK